MTQEEIYNIVKENFGEAITEISGEDANFETLEVNALKIKDVSKFLRDHKELQFNSLMNLSGVDNANGKKVKDEEGNVTEEGHTLSVYYHLDSIYKKLKLTLKVSVDIKKPEVESVVSVWKCANWHEREAYDMFGIIFLNHPNLERILMPYDWDAGYPLRKDYVSPEFYQGMKIPY